MSKYKQSGVDIDLGDKCSEIAYNAAKLTFPCRADRIGKPIISDGGFTGFMDFGDFYIVQNDDGIGTKLAVAEAMQTFDTLGYDLLAMVADDAVCVGAEVVSISNTIDVQKVDPEIIQEMMDGLKKACLEQKIVIPGGEIAELGSLVNSIIWNATTIGIVEKHKLIDCSTIQPGDKIIGLLEKGFRSNGFTLVRHILNERFGNNWINTPYNNQYSWGSAVLVPSTIYHSAILEMTGRYKEERKIDIKGIAHITGGGIPGNLVRILKKNNLGAYLDNLPPANEPMKKLQDFATVKDFDAYRTWNMGIGMILISNEDSKIEDICRKSNIHAQIIGEVKKEPGIELISQGYFEDGKHLLFR